MRDKMVQHKLSGSQPKQKNQLRIKLFCAKSQMKDTKDGLKKLIPMSSALEAAKQISEVSKDKLTTYDN